VGKVYSRKKISHELNYHVYYLLAYLQSYLLSYIHVTSVSTEKNKHALTADCMQYHA